VFKELKIQIVIEGKARELHTFKVSQIHMNMWDWSQSRELECNNSPQQKLHQKISPNLTPLLIF